MGKHSSQSGKVIVVTGVSRGLGHALAVAFARLGHTVCGCARSSESLNYLQTEFGLPHRWNTVDVSCDTDVSRWAREILNTVGPPDLLINNAAVINQNEKLWNVPAAEFDRVMSVNVSGTANVIRHFAPSMVEIRKGVIVNLSSGWGRSVSAEVAPYCATKWAIEGLTQALAEELPPEMCAVPLNPGIINTEMLRSCFASGAEYYPSPEAWAKRAVPFLLGLGPAQNGQSLTVPD